MTVSTPLLELGNNVTGLPFEIHSMEWIAENRWQRNAGAHRHNYFVIIWVISGSGRHRVDMNTYPVRDNTIFCIAPGQVHELQTDGDAHGYVISFTQEFLGAHDNQAELIFRCSVSASPDEGPVIPVSEDMQQELLDVVNNLRKEYSNFFLLRSEILRGYLKIFLVYLSRRVDVTATTAPPSRHTELLRTFSELLEKNFKTEHSVSGYAAAMVITPNHLNEIIKKSTGFPASHHIQQRIVLEAKRQAMYSGVSMKEIAYDLGFDDVAHFSKFFRNGTGLSFTDFKKNLADGFNQ
ncbi:MAG: helix-turn-helix domain-containing protein [Chitinophagaceae bacterium]|nr:MAG: helix-turn-helix domain-containing protein [Chitinophagaceae bacterium]